MYRLLTTLRSRSTARVLRRTTFCEACGQVCSPDCRHEALRDQLRTAAQHADLLYR